MSRHPRPRRLHLAGAALLAAALALLPATAAADPQQANRTFLEAAALYKSGKFDQARVLFERAFEEGGPPVCLYNAADAAERALAPEKAAAAWRRYIDKVGGPEREAAETRLKALEGRPSTVTVTSDPTQARVEVDGRDTGQRTPATLELPAGAHEIVVSIGPGAPGVKQRVELRFGRALLVHLKIAPTLAVPPAPGVEGGPVAPPGPPAAPPGFDPGPPYPGVASLFPPPRPPEPARRLPKLADGPGAVFGVLTTAAIPVVGAGLGTGLETRLFLRLEPWARVPIGLGLEAGITGLGGGGAIFTALPHVSVRVKLARRLAAVLNVGVGYTFAVREGGPLFTGGQGGLVQGLLVAAHTRLELAVTGAFALFAQPIGFDVIPGVFGFSATLLRLHAGGGLGGQFAW